MKKKQDPKQTEGRHLAKEKIFLSGQAYYQKNYMKLATPNPNWDKEPESDEAVDIYKYNFKTEPVKISNDPDYKGALRVTVAGLKIGVIREDYVKKVRQILKKDVKYISAYIHGGPYKSYGNHKELISTNNDDFVTANLGIGYMTEE